LLACRELVLQSEPISSHAVCFFFDETRQLISRHEREVCELCEAIHCFSVITPPPPPPLSLSFSFDIKRDVRYPSEDPSRRTRARYQASATIDEKRSSWRDARSESVDSLLDLRSISANIRFVALFPNEEMKSVSILSYHARSVILVESSLAFSSPPGKSRSSKGASRVCCNGAFSILPLNSGNDIIAPLLPAGGH